MPEAIEQIVMVVCDISQESIPIDQAYVYKTGKYIKKEYEDTYKICDDCGSIYANDDDWIRIGHNQDERVCEDCRDEYFYCDDCNHYYHNDESYSIYDGDKYVCDRCYNDSYWSCSDCGCNVHNDDLYERNWDWYCESCLDNHPADDDDCEEKDWLIMGGDKDYELPKQTAYEAPTEVLSFINNFYDDWRSKFTLYKRKDIQASTTVEFDDKASIRLFDWRKKASYVSEQKFLKYANTMAINSSGVNVEYEYVDIMGVKRTRTESIMSVRDYYKKTLGSKFPAPQPDKNTFAKLNWFEITLSNDCKHKVELAEANGREFSSCQTSDNRDWYARGMHDWFTNGCNVPIAIKLQGKIVGRQLCRLMIDKDWKEYMFLDRLYLNSNYSQLKKKLHNDIAKRLRTMYDLAIPNRSEHDSPVSEYLYDTFHSEWANWPVSLRQPTRVLEQIKRGYYHDSYTRTYEYNGQVYDKIRDKNYIYLVNKK